MRILVLADTHIRPGSRRRLPDVVYDELDQADAVVHAGDFTSGELLDELEGFAPVHAVLGNNDVDLAYRLPESTVVQVAGVDIAILHDSGPRPGREARLARRFPSAQVVVFGHSHVPLDAVGVAGQRLFNPGSATDRRTQPRHTYGRLEVANGRVVRHEIVPVEDSRPLAATP